MSDAAAQRQPSTLVLITREGLGHADVTLQRTLVATWLRLASDNGMLPGAIAFYTEGVRLCVEGSPVLDNLRALEEQGVRLILCKTCLEAFGLLDRVRVGVIGGMPDILAAQWKAAKVIAL